MAKTRVSELAKKYGIPSKEALEKLSAIGEFAKTASSSIELPAVKKFEDTYGAELLAKMKPADDKSAKADASAPADQAGKPAPKPAAKKAAAAPAAETPAEAPAEAAQAPAPAKTAAPRPGPRPGPAKAP
uniref:translation initiation factor IF-2 N-terminal domain-containing protein n=1 Tax=Nocardioides sp. SYSU DS0651 TaxID=3415955 RepID=UPI003F4BEB35